MIFRALFRPSSESGPNTVQLHTHQHMAVHQKGQDHEDSNNPRSDQETRNLGGAADIHSLVEIISEHDEY